MTENADRERIARLEKSLADLRVGGTEALHGTLPPRRAQWILEQLTLLQRKYIEALLPRLPPFATPEDEHKFWDTHGSEFFDPKKIPLFASRDEEAEFWRTHDSSDYQLGEPVEVVLTGEAKAKAALKARIIELEQAVLDFFAPGPGCATPAFHEHPDGDRDDSEPHKKTWNAKLDRLLAAVRLSAPNNAALAALPRRSRHD